MCDREKEVDRLVYRPNGKMGRLAIVKVLNGDNHLVPENSIEDYCRENDIESLTGYTEDDLHLYDDERRNLIRDLEYTFDKERKKRKKALKNMHIKKTDKIICLDDQEILDENEPAESVVNGGYVPLTKEQIKDKYRETLEDYETARLDIQYRPAFYYERLFNLKRNKDKEIIELKKQIRRLESINNIYKEKYFSLLKKCDD
jgi:hypothetical protein